jgi:predicted DNA-binding transcriptional regulator AlpA
VVIIYRRRHCPASLNKQTQIIPYTVQPSAGLSTQHSFHRGVWRSGRLLLSIPLVQLCAAHTPKPRRARFRALRLRCAPGIDSASLRSTSANCETNVFLLACKGQIFFECWWPMRLKNGKEAVQPAISIQSCEPYETARQIALRLHVRPDTIYDWARRRTNPLPSKRITNKVTLFLWSEVQAWVEAGGTLRRRSGPDTWVTQRT